jgi:hypothetical protein
VETRSRRGPYHNQVLDENTVSVYEDEDKRNRTLIIGIPEAILLAMEAPDALRLP